MFRCESRGDGKAVLPYGIDERVFIVQFFQKPDKFMSQIYEIGSIRTDKIVMRSGIDNEIPGAHAIKTDAYTSACHGLKDRTWITFRG